MPTDTERDYDELGFKCGIEIHQQLDTATKLFSPAENRQVDMEAASTVSRFLRPVASELGEIDTAAELEHMKGTTYRYNIYPAVSGLVELDEEPPHPLNQEALDIAIDAALLMHCDIVDELHVMRKLVIDGSNTSGFQRTAILGLNGHIETSKGDVGITDIEIEEESAGIHGRSADEAVFDLDRLGIPLIEIGTDASIQDPDHAKEVAQTLGMLLRSTGKVKRGLGTIRQDVNVSIAGGARVEIKGFQELNLLDTLVRNEVDRQHALVQLQDELAVETVAGDRVDVTETFAASDNDIIRRIIDSDGAVIAFCLHGLEGHMNTELCSGLRLGQELASYAKSQGVKGMMHTDEDVAKYDLEDEFAAVSETLDKEDGDVVVIIAGQRETAENAATVVCDRADLLPHTVPEETRRTEMDTSTRYARPLPGSARMYPETDIPPVELPAGMIADRRADLPETLVEKEARYTEIVGAEYASQLVHSVRWPLFEALCDEYDVEAKTVANILLNVVGELESRNDIQTGTIGDELIASAIHLLAHGEVEANQVRELLVMALEAPDTDIRALADSLESVDEDEIRDAVQSVCEEKADMIEQQGEHAQGALMGLVMSRLDGADGSVVSRILREELEKRV